MPLFDHFASVRVGVAGQSGIRVDDLRMQFTVKKSELPTPNTALITINNLSESKRNNLGTTGTVATLQAGYADDPINVRTIAEMSVIDAKSFDNPPDVRTVLTCQAGINEVRGAKIAPSYTGGKGAIAIVREVVKGAGLTLRDMSEITDDIYHNGFSEAGPLNDVLDKLAGKLQARWSMQNGEVQFTPLDKPSDLTIVLVSATSGLIEVQRRNKVGSPLTPGQKDGWTARSLLLPQIEPGGTVRLKSKKVEGTFRVAALQHTGDTHGEDWFTDLELEEYVR